LISLDLNQAPDRNSIPCFWRQRREISLAISSMTETITDDQTSKPTPAAAD